MIFQKVTASGKYGVASTRPPLPKLTSLHSVISYNSILNNNFYTIFLHPLCFPGYYFPLFP